MADRQLGYGFTAECAEKIASKYDADADRQAKEWIEQVTGETLNGCCADCLKDGIVLCKLMNVLYPGSVTKVHHSDAAFKQMENIGRFLDGCVEYGCSKTDLFQTVDLFEETNMPAVIQGLFALGRKARINGFKGPALGPKESTGEKKYWSDDQLRAGRQGVINLQAGWNKGANQSGMNFGLGRQIFMPELMNGQECDGHDHEEEQ